MGNKQDKPLYEDDADQGQDAQYDQHSNTTTPLQFHSKQESLQRLQSQDSTLSHALPANAVPKRTSLASFQQQQQQQAETHNHVAPSPSSVSLQQQPSSLQRQTSQHSLTAASPSSNTIHKTRGLSSYSSASGGAGLATPSNRNSTSHNKSNNPMIAATQVGRSMPGSGLPPAVHVHVRQSSQNAIQQQQQQQQQQQHSHVGPSPRAGSQVHCQGLNQQQNQGLVCQTPKNSTSQHPSGIYQHPGARAAAAAAAAAASSQNAASMHHKASFAALSTSSSSSSNGSDPNQRHHHHQQHNSQRSSRRVDPHAPSTIHHSMRTDEPLHILPQSMLPTPKHADANHQDWSLMTPSSAATARQAAAVEQLSNDTVFGESFKMQSHHLSVDDFELLKVIGKGSFGKVMQVRKKDTGRIYALKVLKKAQLVARKQVAHTKTERKVLEEVHSPFLVSLKFAFQTANKLYMVSEFFTGGELFFHLKSNGRFTEERAKFYAAEIVLALECLHQSCIVYRDLKPENVLLDDGGHVRLTDFGLSKEGVSLTQFTNTFCGTPEYLAPEVILSEPYGTAIDNWSLGTLLYEMLVGLPPYYSNSLHTMYEKIIRAKLHFPDHLSRDACEILAALLDRNPRTRLGSRGGAAEIKAHPFFADIDWSLLAVKGVRAPFVPNSSGQGKLDTLNIDEEFKRETPRDTPMLAEPSALAQNGALVAFDGFTYVGAESVGVNSKSYRLG